LDPLLAHIGGKKLINFGCTNDGDHLQTDAGATTNENVTEYYAYIYVEYAYL